MGFVVMFMVLILFTQAQKHIPPRSFRSLFFGIALILAIASIGRADTRFFSDKPSSVIGTNDAAKSTKPVWECQKVKQGPNINPVKVPGSTTIWSSDPGTGADDVASLLADGKTAYRCKTMQLDKSSGRMKSAAL